MIPPSVVRDATDTVQLDGRRSAIWPPAFRTDVRLYVNNGDRTKLVDGVLRQVDVVRTVLGSDFADVEVHGVLCFVGCEWGWVMRTKRVKGVTALWPKALPGHVSIPGNLSDRVTEIASRLRIELRPAT